MKNPLDGIVPDFTIFGAEFTAIWQNGTWHFRDQSLARNLEDVQRIGIPYAAGC